MKKINQKAFLFRRKIVPERIEGFTLIELLVVISIIGILSIIGAPTFIGIREKAQETKKRTDLDAISKAYEIKYQKTGQYQALTGNDFTTGQIPTPPGGGSYFVVGPNSGRTGDSGFTACVSATSSETCLPSSANCICKSSAYEVATVITLPNPSPSLSATPTSGPTVIIPSSNPTPASSTLGNGLISYWNFDETSGNTTANSISGGANGSTTATTIGNGKLGKDRVFAGFDYITIASTFKLPTPSGSVSLWVKPSSWIGVTDIMGAGTGGNDFRFYMDSGTSALYGFFINGEYRVSSDSSGIASVGAWNHIVLTWSSTSSKLYKNSVQRGTKSPGPPIFNQSGLTIGRFNSAAFKGELDEVGVWNRELSSYEVAQLYNSSNGTTYSNGDFTNLIPVPTATPAPTLPPLPSSYSPKVLLLIYNPIIESAGGQRLVTLANWNNPDDITTTFINSVKTSSGGFVNYQIAERMEIDGIPVKNDGFQYTDATYLACTSSGGSNCHNPDLASYVAMINQSDACTKRNAGTIDELWIFGGPWFGYWESNLAGPAAFWYNSSPTYGTTCNKLLPVMGFNYAVGPDNMFHDVGHRLESTMIRIYGAQANDPSNPWYKFRSINATNPGNGGCGDTHNPVNSQGAYEYGSSTTVQSTCNDFKNYPNLTGAKQSINCNAWGCSHLGYLEWMFGSVPRAAGQNAQGILNNWWHYLINPQTSIIDSGL